MGTKISALPAAATLTGSEVISGVQSGATVKLTPAQILTYTSTGQLAYLTWALLNARSTAGLADGTVAKVLTDVGTHTDPVVGGTVNNAGVYSWHPSAPAGWVRIASLDADAAAVSAAAAAVSAASAATAVTASFVPANVQHQQQERYVSDMQARSHYFLDSATGLDSYLGQSGRFPKQTVAGLMVTQSLTKASFTKTGGYTNVYQITVTKSAPYPWGSRLAAYYSVSGSTEPEWFALVGSITEVDALLTSMFIDYPDAQTAILYIRPPTGTSPVSDTNAYSAVLTPPKTAHIGLRAGSVFTDKSFEPPFGYTRVGGYGNGALPYIDSGKTFVSGDFTLSTDAAVGGGSNTTVYEVTVTAETAVRWLNSPRFVLYEIDAQGLVHPFESAANAAAVATRAGSCFAAQPGNTAVAAWGDATAKVFLQPRFSTDPRSDGKTYRAAVRKAGVSVTNNTDTAEGRNFDGQEIEGLHTGYEVDGHGSLLSNADAVVKRCLMTWGQKHNTIIQTGRWENCIAFGGYRGASATLDHYAYTFYAQDAGRSQAAVTESGSVFPDHYHCSTATWYCHGSTAANPLNFRLNRFFLYNAGPLVSNVTEAAHYTDTLVRCRETIRGYYASLAAIQADTGASDGDIGVVEAGTVGNQGHYRWNAAIAVPAWEQLNQANGLGDWQNGGIALPLPTVAFPNTKGIVRRAMMRSSSKNMIVLNSAGATPSRTQPISIKHSVFHILRRVPTGIITLNIFNCFDVQNNFIIPDVNGCQPFYSPEAVQNSFFRYNIIYDVAHTAANGPVMVELPKATVPANLFYTTMDYNVYIMPVGASRIFKIGGTNYTVNNAATFATYKAAVAALGIEQNSVYLNPLDAVNLFVGDPALGDFRLKQGTIYYQNGSTPLVFTDGTPINTTAGPLEHLHWNTKAVLPGPPEAWPIPPKTEADCELYCRAPWLWDWYTGATTLPLEVR